MCAVEAGTKQSSFYLNTQQRTHNIYGHYNAGLEDGTTSVITCCSCNKSSKLFHNWWQLEALLARTTMPRSCSTPLASDATQRYKLDASHLACTPLLRCPHSPTRALAMRPPYARSTSYDTQYTLLSAMQHSKFVPGHAHADQPLAYNTHCWERTAPNTLASVTSM